jgi:hypothetical protein
MRLIDADKFLKYLIFSKHIDGLTCGEVKEAIEMCKVDIFDKIKADIISYEGDCRLSVDEYPSCKQCTDNVFESIYGILDKYKAEVKGEESEK